MTAEHRTPSYLPIDHVASLLSVSVRTIQRRFRGAIQYVTIDGKRRAVVPILSLIEDGANIGDEQLATWIHGLEDVRQAHLELVRSVRDLLGRVAVLERAVGIRKVAS